MRSRTEHPCARLGHTKLIRNERLQRASQQLTSKEKYQLSTWQRLLFACLVCHRASIALPRHRDRQSKENMRDRSRHRDGTGYRDNGSGSGREWQRGDFGGRDSSREANNRDGGGGGGGGGVGGRRGPAPLKGLHDELGAYGEIGVTWRQECGSCNGTDHCER